MRQYVIVFIIMLIAVATAMPSATAQEKLNIPGFVAYEMGVPETDATRYLREFGDTLTNLLQKELRVCFDGFGAFEPIYEEDPATGEVLHGVAFRFSTERALAAPGLETVFKDEFAKAMVDLDQRAIKNLDDKAASVAVPLMPESASELLDILIFSVLYLTDQNESLRLGNDVGVFYGAVQQACPATNHNASRSNRSSGIAANFIDDYLYETEIAVCVHNDWTNGIPTGKRGAVHGDPDANRYDFGHDAAVSLMQDALDLMWSKTVGDVVSEDVIGEVTSGVRAGATDYNSSRSNTTSAIMTDLVGDLLEEAAALARAGSHNASRSQLSSGIIARYNPGLFDSVEAEAATAQDYNGTRSNRSAGIVSAFLDDIFSETQTCVRAHLFGYTGVARNYNKTRPARIQEIVEDFFKAMAVVAEDSNSSRAGNIDGLVENFLGELGEVYKAAAPVNHNTTRSNRTAALVGDFAGTLFEEISSAVKAQDYNSSRSNTTALRLNGAVDDLLSALDDLAPIMRPNRPGYMESSITHSDLVDLLGDAGACAKATSHNASRSNRSSGLYRYNLDLYLGTQATAAAQDYNSSRSNTTSLRYHELADAYSGENQSQKAPYATDYNSSRSNTTSSIIVIFKPGQALRHALNTK